MKSDEVQRADTQLAMKSDEVQRADTNLAMKSVKFKEQILICHER